MRNTMLFLFVSIVMLGGCDTSVIMTTTILEKKANAFYEAGQYDEALRFCDRLCKRKPDDYKAWELKAFINMELENNVQALEDAQYAYDLSPDKVESLRMRSYAYSVNGMHEESIADLNKIIGRSPVSATNQVELGAEYEQLMDYEKAIECYRLALSYNEEHSMAWNNYASVLSMAADESFLNGKKARNFAARAVKFADTDEEKCYAWDTFGSALAELGDFQRAIKAGKKAISFTEDPKLISDIKKRINGYKKSEPARYEKKQTVSNTGANNAAATE